MGERLHGMQEAVGSSPIISIIFLLIDIDYRFYTNDMLVTS